MPRSPESRPERLEAKQDLETEPKNPTVLVVDDNKEIRDVARLLLEQKGYSVLEAADTNEAEERIEEKRPDAIVLNVCMPDEDGEDGLGWLQRIQREQPRLLENIPVLLWTAQSAYLVKRRCRKLKIETPRMVIKPNMPVNALQELLNPE